MKKAVEINEKANEELLAFSDEVQARFIALFKILEMDGFLKEPFAKRLNKDIFEIRVKHQGQWRAIYAYLKSDKIIILSAFSKKTQKTPLKELKKAEKRLQRHI